MRLVSQVRDAVLQLANFGRFVHKAYLRMAGVKIGTGGMISIGAKIDTHGGSVTIGNNCTITWGCVILAHDMATSLLNSGQLTGEGRVVINDNVFIGVNSVVLPNVTIGKNSIIGAGSVVSGDVPPDALVAGNPARVLRRIDEDRE